MNTRFSLVILAMVAVGAAAGEPADGQVSLNIKQVLAAMGPKVVAQPVFHHSEVKGLRVYGTDSSDQLKAQGIGQGSLMTHVCGIPARDIYAGGGNISCSVDASREVEVTFQIAEQERKILIKR